MSYWLGSIYLSCKNDLKKKLVLKKVQVLAVEAINKEITMRYRARGDSHSYPHWLEKIYQIPPLVTFFFNWKGTPYPTEAVAKKNQKKNYFMLVIYYVKIM